MGQRENIAIGAKDRSSRFPVRAPEALAGNRVVTIDELERFQVLVFNPSTTSRDVTLPAAAACKDVSVFIANQGTTTGTLVVKDSGGTAIATIGSTAANDVSGAWFFSDGTSWFGALGA